MIAKTAALDHEYRMFLSDETFGNFASVLVGIIESYEANMDKLLQLNKAEQNNLILACISALALSGALGIFYSRHVASRLEAIKENAQRFAKGVPMQPPLGGSDEIAEVDRTLHHMTEELTRIANREQAVSQLRAQVVAMVTHDLRSPLQTLSAFLRIAENKVEDKSKKEAIQQAIKEVSRMSTMIGDLLELEKLQAKKTQLDMVPFSIAAALERATESTAEAAEESGVTINVETSQHDMVLADEERLVQALGGLIRNAIKRSSSGAVVVIRAIPANDQSLAIDIQDHGTVIDGSTLLTVFEPYAKANSEAEPSDLVFALAVSKGLLELHGGSVCVKSSSPSATVFSVELPSAG
jgi:two-component system sensor histidine kinase BaeS